MLMSLVALPLSDTRQPLTGDAISIFRYHLVNPIRRCKQHSLLQSSSSDSLRITLTVHPSNIKFHDFLPSPRVLFIAGIILPSLFILSILTCSSSPAPRKKFNSEGTCLSSSRFESTSGKGEIARILGRLEMHKSPLIATTEPGNPCNIRM